MKKIGGTILMILGIFLLTCAGVLTLSNMRQQEEAGKEATEIIEAFREKLETQNIDVPEVSETLQNDEAVPEQTRTMETVEIDGKVFIGALQFPTLGLQLPVLRDWDYDNLKTAPCLYYGSIYTDDMVICAHNYNSHFGRLSELKIGDEIIFCTADGELYHYTVGELETLTPTDVEYMTEGEWPLTLFTCTWGGQSRVTVRCEKAE